MIMQGNYITECYMFSDKTIWKLVEYYGEYMIAPSENDRDIRIILRDREDGIIL